MQAKALQFSRMKKQLQVIWLGIFCKAEEVNLQDLNVEKDWRVLAR